MSRITVSSRFRIVIPKDVRDRLKIRPGQKIEAFAIGDRIALVPMKPAEQMRGFLKGMDPNFRRGPDREI